MVRLPSHVHTNVPDLVKLAEEHVYNGHSNLSVWL